MCHVIYGAVVDYFHFHCDVSLCKQPFLSSLHTSALIAQAVRVLHLLRIAVLAVPGERAIVIAREGDSPEAREVLTRALVQRH